MAPLQGKSLLSRPLEEKEKITKWLSVGGVQIEGTAFHKDLEAGENIESISKYKVKTTK